MIGTLFTVHHQPYGTYTLRVEQIGTYNGARTLSGTIVEGTETSRLFQHSITRSIAGEHATVYGVKDWEVEKREATRVAM